MAGSDLTRLEANPNKAESAIVYPIVSFVLFGLCTSIVGLRLFTRLHVVRSFGIDDGFLVAAYILNVAAIGIVAYGFSLDNQDPYRFAHPYIPALELNLELTYWFTLIWFLTLGLLKISILLLYRRLQHGSRGHMIIYILLAFVVAQYIQAFFGTMFICNRIGGSWDLSTLPNGCIDIPTFFLAQAGLNILSDMLLLILPIPVILGLKISTRKRAILLSIVALAAVPCAASVVRTYGLHVFFSAPDLTSRWPLLELCMMIETNVAIIATSLPTLFPLFTRLVALIRTKMYGSYSFPVRGPDDPPTIGEMRVVKKRDALDSGGTDSTAESSEAYARTV
jgi:hypothetical protein